MNDPENTQLAEKVVLINQGNSKAASTWQNNLLPLMKGMVIVLAVFFFVASFFQLLYLQSTVQKSPQIDLKKMDSLLRPHDPTTFKEKLEAAQFKSSCILEENIVANRYHEANVLLMSSLWIRYLGFVTGMILSFVGAVFILGKLQEATTEVEARFRDTGINLKSASPGIILAVLGAVLMTVTIVMQHQLNVRDGSIYFNKSGQQQTIMPGDKPPVNFEAPPKPDSIK